MNADVADSCSSYEEGTISSCRMSSAGGRGGGVDLELRDVEKGLSLPQRLKQGCRLIVGSEKQRCRTGRCKVTKISINIFANTSIKNRSRTH